MGLCFGKNCYSVASSLLILLFFVGGCTNSSEPSTANTDLFTKAKQNPTGNWQIKETASGTTYNFTVGTDKIDYSGNSFYSASGTVGTVSLSGFLMVDDSTTPGAGRVLWLRTKSGGSLDGESNMILKVENNEFVLGGDSATETQDLWHLKRI